MFESDDDGVIPWTALASSQSKRNICPFVFWKNRLKKNITTQRKSSLRGYKKIDSSDESAQLFFLEIFFRKKSYNSGLMCTRDSNALHGPVLYTVGL